MTTDDQGPAASSPRPAPELRRHDVSLAANNGEIGGGEVMLLRIAEALVGIGVSVEVIAPDSPGALADAAERQGFPTVRLHASGRWQWMRALRSWDRDSSRGLLWCNGLVPAAATAGRPNRLVHLHQHPGGVQRALAMIARWGAHETLVPSEATRTHVRGSTVFPNWTAHVKLEREEKPDSPVVVGFLGRLSPDKGVVVLADALRLLDRAEPGRYRLLVAGASRFVDAEGAAQAESALTSIDHLVQRMGWVTREELLSRVDVLVVPSIWPESFGLVAIEAMAAGVPVIVSDAGALSEIVGPDGVVVPAGDVAALAEAIAGFSAGTTVIDVDALHRRWSEHFSPAVGRVRVAELMTRRGVPHAALS